MRTCGGVKDGGLYVMATAVVPGDMESLHRLRYSVEVTSQPQRPKNDGSRQETSEKYERHHFVGSGRRQLMLDKRLTYHCDTMASGTLVLWGRGGQ